MIIINIIIFLLVGFLGYLIGRWGDNYLNFWIGDPNWIPDHWIDGLLLIIASMIFKGTIEFSIFSFGLGLFISDLKDFLNLKFYGSDKKTKETKKFWHID